MKADEWMDRFLGVTTFLFWLGVVVYLPISLYRENVALWKLPFLLFLWALMVATGVYTIQKTREGTVGE